MKHYFTLTENKTIELAHVGTEESLIADFKEQHKKVVELTKEAIAKSKEELKGLNPSLEADTVADIEELAKYVHYKKQIKINEESLTQLEATKITIKDIPVFEVNNIGKDLILDNYS